MLTSRTFRSWLRPRTNSTRKPSRIDRSNLRLQLLEDRAVPATITVTDNGDLVQVDSLVTLREALEAITTGADSGDVVATGAAYGTNDTVLFQVGITSPINTSTELLITKALSITGPGSGLLSVTNIAGASATSRVFNNSNATGLVTISGLTISGGNLLDADGGGILMSAAGNMTLDNVVVTSNLASSATANLADGGGISNNSTGTLTITNSTISNNSTTSSNDGGGVNNETTGPLVITNSTFSGNVAGTGTTGDGGAIYTNAASLVTITGSTFSSNTAASRGGGLYFTGPAAGSTISNSTVTLNKTTGGTGTGGGIFFSGVANVTLTSVTISNNSAAVASGGGIGSSGTVTLNSCVVSGNTSTTTGGGISSTGGILTINNSSITGNSAKTTGGGINNTTGTLNINSSTIDSNNATTSGGGINASSGTVNINAPLGSAGSTISNNTSVLGGGLSLSTSGTVTIRNSTIAKNTATGTTGGGGIAIGTSILNIQNTTIAMNAATGVGSTGGGFRRTSGTINLNSSIIADNTSLAGGANGHSTVAAGVTITLNNSLIGTDIAGDSITYNGTGFTNVASGLDTSLQLNGAVAGTPLTVALLSGSAINGGNNSLGLTTDARGAGFPRQQGTGTDIGSFESPDPAPIAAATSPDVAVGGGTTQTVTVVYTDINGSQLIDRSTIGVGNDITVTGPGGFTVNPAFVSADSAVDAKTITATYSFTAPDNTVTDTWDFSDNGTYTIAINASEVFDKDGTALSVLPGTIGTFAAKMPTTWTVDIATDEDDGNTAPGDLSLREAIKLANTAVGISDIILFDATLNAVTLTFSLGEIAISDPVTITGNGKTQTILSGTTSRLFSLGIAGAGGLVSMSGMRITGGNSAAIGGAFSIADDALTLTNVHLTGNKTTGVIDGGAIHTTTGTVRIIDSLVENNTSGDDGGVVYASTSATVEFTRSTMSGNTAAGRGGVVYMNSGGALTVIDSTMNNNVANTATTTSGGGAIQSFTAATVINNSTISGNTATNGVGGGIRISSSGSLTINNSTIANNSAAALGGGGISLTSATSVVSIKSTIIANNINATHPDFWSSTTTPMNIAADASLIETLTDADITLTGTYQTGVDPLLAGLANYGGTTLTHGLLPTSPALNTGSNLLGLSFDQRGSGFPRVVGGNPDVGAFEGELKIPTATATLVDVTTAGGTTYVVTVIYSDETGVDHTSIGLGDVTLTGPGYGSPESPIAFTQSGPGLTNTATYTFNAPGGTFNGPDNGVYSLNLLGGQVFDTDVPTPNAAFPGVIDTFLVNIPQVLTVDIATDEDDGNTAPGDLSLREAFKLSNASVGAQDTIQFDGALSSQTLLLTLGQITITDPFDMTGLGAANLAISGNFASRLFTFGITGVAPVSTISSITLRDGKVTGSGGAIVLTDDALTLNNVVVTGNSASSTGGAIQMTGATLKVNNSTISNNISGSTGGAIQTATAAAVIEITNSTISGNTGTTGGGVYLTSASISVTGSTFSGNNATSGGAISASTGSITVTNSTISSNVSTGTGGGLRLSSTGTLTVTDSTISGNTGTTGGGIYTASGSSSITSSTLSNNVATSTSGGGGLNVSTGNVTINNSTFSGNSATNASGIGGAVRGSSSTTMNVSNSTFTGNSAGGNGGGAFGFSGTTAASLPILTITSTIVAQNLNTLHPDLYTGATTVALTATVNDSIIGADSGLVLISGSNNQTGTVGSPLDAKLKALASNGGPTQTHGLNPGSPAFDVGSNGLGFTNDQRGAGFPRLVNGVADVGAFEAPLQPVPTVTGTASNVTTSGGTTFDVTVTFKDDLGINISTIDINDVVVKTAFGGTTLNAVSFVATPNSGVATPVTVVYTFNAPGGVWDPTDTDRYSVWFVGTVADADLPTPNNVPSPAQLTTFLATLGARSMVVDALGDVDDDNYTTGNLTVREAVNFSNINTLSVDSISFNLASNSTISLTKGELKTTDAVTVTGPGSGLLTIDAGAASRIFNINDGVVGPAVFNISGLKLTGGKVTGDGGAIFIQDENVTLTDLTITGNSATVDGGGINLEVDGGSLTLLNSTVSNNAGGTTGDADGGGINVEGASTTTIKNSTIANNTTFDDGGGILFQKRAAGHTVLIEGTTISGNTSNAATGGGGGINFGGTFLGLTIRNSTVSGNFTKKDGGGLQFYAVVDPVSIQNTTIAFNTATVNGGGINQFTDTTGTITMESTIVSNNTAATGADINSTTGAVVSTNNAIGSFNVTNFTDGGGNVIGQNLQLTPLAFNGGPTQTIRPSGGPVVGAGSNPASLTTDQRGAGFPRLLGGAVDIGSFEVDPDQPFATIALTNVTTSGGTVYSFTVTYFDNVAIDVSTIGTGDVTVSGPGGFTATPTKTAIDFNFNGTPRVVTYEFTPPGTAWDNLDNGTYTVSLGLDEVKDAPGGKSITDGPLGSFKVAIPVVVTVDTLVDENDGIFTAGDLSLREAIGLSNGSPTSINVISFASSLFSGGPQTMTLALGEMAITANVTISGPGANKLTIDAGASSRIFNISDATTAVLDVAMSGMTLANGKSASANDGGAITVASENLTLDAMVLRNNTASRYGGAIHVAAGQTGILTIRNSALVNNTALDGDTTFGGGAIIMNGTASKLFVYNSTLTNNQALAGVGGAILMYAAGNGICQIENSTITGNTAINGGGIRVFSDVDAKLNLISSIVSGNSFTTGTQADIQSGTLTPVTATLTMIGSTTGMTVMNFDGFTTANIGISPVLGTLKNNGGPTPTMALLLGSPAINAGSNGNGFTTDQRGGGYVRVFGAAADVGAFEVQAPAQVTSIVINGGDVQRSRVLNIRVNFNSRMTLPVNPADAFTLTRQTGAVPVGLVATVDDSGPTTSVLLTFAPGAAVDFNSLSDGRYTLGVSAAMASDPSGQLLDGDANSTAGGDYSLVGTPANGLFRFFGDITGDGNVAANDFIQFRLSLGGSNPTFDFDNDGAVAASDFIQFRLRFGGSI